MSQNQHRYNVPELWGGIECTINRVRDRFFDQLHYSGHYNRPGDVAELAATGIKKIRYPVLWEKHQPQKDSVIDWRWASERLQAFRQHSVDVIASLVHHGSGPAFTHLLDPAFPELLALYAGRVSQQFPFIDYYTPVNEPLTTARFSGLYGLWYPHVCSDGAFLKMLLNEVKAVVRSMQEIRKANPDAKLVQTEDLAKIYSTPTLRYQADFENERRWLTYDLLCGKVNKDHSLWPYLIRSGITEAELAFFEENVCVPHVFGFNYYVTSERFLDERVHRYSQHTHGGNGIHTYADVEAVRVEMTEETGLSPLLREAWKRYRQPLALTEVHLHCHREEQLRWFSDAWSQCRQLREEGIDVKAVTAWSMLGSFGWNKLLTADDEGAYEPGVFDVQSGNLRPTALARHLTCLNMDLPQHPLSVDAGWWRRSTRYFRHLPSVLSRQPTPFTCSRPLLIIGKRGTLGRALARVCEDRFINYRLLGREDCNLRDLASVEHTIEVHRPWAVVNAAGFVRVDDAEREQAACFLDNTTAAHNLALAAARFQTKLVTFSSDLVFDGEKQTPYSEDDKPNPLNTYGLSKQQAEELVLTAAANSLVIRTSAFFGPWDEYNFAHAVRKSLRNHETINVAKDCHISPTYVPDLVHATLDLLVDDECGIWHLANGGQLTWADFANEVADRFNLNRHGINAVATEELHHAARRPLYSVLTSRRGLLLPSIDDALRRYTEAMKAFPQKRVGKEQKERA